MRRRLPPLRGRKNFDAWNELKTAAASGRPTGAEVSGTHPVGAAISRLQMRSRVERMQGDVEGVVPYERILGLRRNVKTDARLMHRLFCHIQFFGFTLCGGEENGGIRILLRFHQPQCVGDGIEQGVIHFFVVWHSDSHLSCIIGQFHPNFNRSICHNIDGDLMHNRLKQLRKKRGYTQVKMQMLTGIDQSDYSKIENGKRYYTFEQCRKIAIALDTSMDYLAGLTDEEKPYLRTEQTD